MPTKPLQHAPAKPLGALTQGGTRPRLSPHRRGYDVRWGKVRRLTLAKEPLCRSCKAAGVTMLACEVDHIVPIAEQGARYDPANLQPLCKRCHSRKTSTKDGGFGRKVAKSGQK